MPLSKCDWIGFQVSLAVGLPLREVTWGTFRCGRAVACGLLDGSGQGSVISCPVTGWGLGLTASSLGL